MTAWTHAALIVLFATVAAVGSAIFHPSKPAWYVVESTADLRWEITPDDARKLMAVGEVVWIDARTRSDYEKEHLPEAILLNAEEWGELMFNNQNALQSALDCPVIVYCDGEGCARSAEIAVRLRELLGLEPVYVLKGAWRDLKEVP